MHFFTPGVESVHAFFGTPAAAAAGGYIWSPSFWTAGALFLGRSAAGGVTMGLPRLPSSSFFEETTRWVSARLCAETWLGDKTCPKSTL